METESQSDFPWLEDATHEEMARAVEAMYRVHKLIRAITDLDALLEYISQESQRVAGAEASSIILYDPDVGDLYFHTALGDYSSSETLKREIRLKLGEGIAGVAAAERRSVVADNAQQDDRFFRSADRATNFTTRNVLAVPMVDHEELIGVLEVINKVGDGGFTLLDVRVMEMFSTLAATSISNARLVKDRIATERLAAIGQAVTGLSHYTKNIVSGMSSSAELIETGLRQGNLELLAKTWPVFRRSTQRISHCVQDMLSFSKPRKPCREPFSLRQLLDEAYESYAELFSKRGVEVTITCANVPDTILAEPASLYRSLLNLLANAADAAPDTGGRIAVRATGLPSGILEIVVEDNGPGVPEALEERIFDPFFSTKGAKGTGLGLAITRKVVEEHGGQLQLRKSSLGGAAFHITLPAGAPERTLLSP